jgi:hypothetical protein
MALISAITAIGGKATKNASVGPETATTSISRASVRRRGRAAMYALTAPTTTPSKAPRTAPSFGEEKRAP